MRATFPCQHRYNKNMSICATPCDGIDDMCLGYEDEENCKIPTIWRILMHVTLFTFTSGILAFASTMIWLKYGRATPVQNERAKRKNVVSLSNLEEMGERELYGAIRSSKEFGAVVLNFVSFVWSTKDIVEQIKLCKNLFEMEKAMHNNVDDVNLHIMNNVGTNDTVGRFYDLLDKSISVRLEKWFYRKLPRPIYSLIHNFYGKIAIIIISNLVKVILHYTDIYKDTFLAYIIYARVLGYQLGNGSFPQSMFLTLVASIVATEVLNLASLILNPEFSSWGKKKKVLSILFSPLIPAYMIFLQTWNEVIIIIEAKKMADSNPTWETHQEGLLAKIKDRIYKTKALVFQFRANENSFEHFLQLVVIILIILFNWRKNSSQSQERGEFISV